MRRLILGIGVIGLLTTALAGTATAGHDEEYPCWIPEGCGCPDYERVVHVDEADSGISQGAHGETRVTGAGIVYLDVREVMSHGYLFSVWIGVESNGEPGYQDPGCSENPDTVIF